VPHASHEPIVAGDRWLIVWSKTLTRQPWPSRGSARTSASGDPHPGEQQSILATIERRFDLAPLSSRDAAVHDLSSVFHAKQSGGR
jgi:hypothetical protein